jgi:hypothetical protein
MQTNLLVQALPVLFGITGLCTITIVLGIRHGFRRGKGVTDL